MRASQLSSTAEILEQPLHDMLLVSASSDRLDGRIDIVIGPTQGDLPVERVVRDPAGTGVFASAESDATDVDDGRESPGEPISAILGPKDLPFPALNPDRRHMRVSDEAERTRLGGEMPIDGGRRIQVIESVIRVQRTMGELDSVDGSRFRSSRDGLNLMG
jgi:hypothetical protein